MKKLLFSAFIGSSNLGDQAIFETIVRRLKNKKHISLAAFTLDRTKHKNTPFVRFVQTNNILTVIFEIYASDLLVIGGGGIIQDETTIYNVLRHTFKALIAWSLGRKFMFFAIGVSPIQSRMNRILARFVLQKAAAVTVRDKESKVNAQKLGVTREIVVTADPVVGMEPMYKKSISRKPYIVVCLRHWFDINRYIPVALVHELTLRSGSDLQKYERFTSTLAEFFDWIVQEYKYRIVFIPFFDRRDNHVGRDVVCKMKFVRFGKNIKRKQTVKNTMPIIAGAQFLIGMRLHSLIFGAITQTPFLALSYSEKIVNFLSEIRLEQNSITIDPLSIESLKERFKQLSSDREYIKSTLKQRMRLLVRREKENYNILEKVVYSGT